MSEYRKLTHVYYKCDYHIVFTPKYRFQILEGMVKSLVEHDLQLISSWKDVQIIELNVQSSINVSYMIGYKAQIANICGSFIYVIAL